MTPARRRHQPRRVHRPGRRPPGGGPRPPHHALPHLIVAFKKAAEPSVTSLALAGTRRAADRPADRHDLATVGRPRVALLPHPALHQRGPARGGPASASPRRRRRRPLLRPRRGPRDRPPDEDRRDLAPRHLQRVQRAAGDQRRVRASRSRRRCRARSWTSSPAAWQGPGEDPTRHHPPRPRTPASRRSSTWSGRSPTTSAWRSEGPPPTE